MAERRLGARELTAFEKEKTMSDETKKIDQVVTAAQGRRPWPALITVITLRST